MQIVVLVVALLALGQVQAESSLRKDEGGGRNRSRRLNAATINAAMAAALPGINTALQASLESQDPVDINEASSSSVTIADSTSSCFGQSATVE